MDLFLIFSFWFIVQFQSDFELLEDKTLFLVIFLFDIWFFMVFSAGYLRIENFCEKHLFEKGFYFIFGAK